jgi:hypothetical protein
MTKLGLILFSIAATSYLVGCKYIFQLVREVNGSSGANTVSLRNWHKGLKIHKAAFPESAVRMRIVVCLATTFGLALVGFLIEAKHLTQKLAR